MGMLVLTRKEKQTIIIRDRDGNDLGEIAVLSIQPGRINLGMNGDDFVFVRGELANTDRDLDREGR